MAATSSGPITSLVRRALRLPSSMYGVRTEFVGFVQVCATAPEPDSGRRHPPFVCNQGRSPRACRSTPDHLIAAGADREHARRDPDQVFEDPDVLPARGRERLERAAG